MDIPKKQFTEDDAPKHMDNVECLDWAEGANYGYEYLRQQLAEQTSAEPHVWMDESGRHIYAKTEGYFPLYRHPPSVEVLLEALRKVVPMAKTYALQNQIPVEEFNEINALIATYKPTEG
jgi:hypothetical protein